MPRRKRFGRLASQAQNSSKASVFAG